MNFGFSIAFVGGVGTSEMVLLGIVALMLYGSRLPEVARNLGGTYRGLKKNVDDFKREFEAADIHEPARKVPEASEDDENFVQTDAPKFTPPPS